MALTFDQVKAIYEKDMARAGEKIHDATQLPLEFEDITAEWLTATLCARHPGAAVTGFTLSPVVEGTTNRRLITLEYNEAGQRAELTQRVFCKATQGLVNRYVLGLCGAASTEVRFYNHVRPLLDDVSAPEAVFANHDDDTFNSIVMLKDLSSDVSEFCTQETPVSRERAEDMIGLLARMHGQGYSKPAVVEQLSRFATWPEYFEKTLAFGMQQGSEQGFDRAVDLIPARLHRRAAEIWPATVKAVKLNDRLPHTLAHGDVHLKNWYITHNGAMSLSDWQCMSRGHWGRDVGYALGTALSIENRRAWERDLLKLYLDTLHAAGGPKHSFEEGWQHYRQQLMSALTWWTITFNPAPGMPDMQPLETAREFVKRLSTAIDDLETLDSLD